MALVFLHVDEHLLAIDKPPGRIVIPGRGADERTLQQEVAQAYGRVWVVHRLDRGTSGVLLFARTAPAHRALNLAFDRHEVAKRYLAIVRGNPANATIDVPIAAARRGRMKVTTIDDPLGKRAATEVRVLETFPARPPLPTLSVIEAVPLTGRTHQIRVHLASAGTPLAVDADYGDPGPVFDARGDALLARTPLHAASLELSHPATGGALRLEAPMPADMQAVIRAAGGG